MLAAVLAVGLGLSRGGGAPSAVGRHPSGAAHQHKARPPPPANPLDPDWKGDGQTVTFAFGGDVHFPAGTILGDRLAADPARPRADGARPALGRRPLDGELRVGPDERDVPGATVEAVRVRRTGDSYHAFRAAGATLITEANNHGEDCGPPGLQMALTTRNQTGYTILGIGQNAAQAFTPYTATIHGQHIAIIAATQVIDSDLQTAWTATATQPGLASAYDVNDLVAAVEAARQTADTVIVYLHWGTELDACPNPLQEPLAQALVQAGADIIVGTHAHVLLGGGYLGSAYVDYGLGNFAFYNNTPPENSSGSLVIRRPAGTSTR